MINALKNERIFLIFIALFKCLPTFALDTYSPAIPEIASFFLVAQPAVLKTFTSYYLGFALGILIWGTLSDIYGRKLILQVGAILYVISSILCPLSSSLSELVLARFGQGLGDAACATVAIAILRDCYSGSKLLKTMSNIGSFAMLAPIIAPVIGTTIMSITRQWQYIFHFLTIYGVILLIFSQLMSETLELKNRSEGLWHGFRQYLLHSKNHTFMLFTFSVAMICAAELSFVSASAIIYMKIFQLTKWQYAMYFALNGLIIIFANQVTKKLVDLMDAVSITRLAILFGFLNLLIAYLILKFVILNLSIFIIAMCLSTFFLSICANTTGTMCLQSVKESFGTAIAIKNFLAVFCAGIANYIVTKFTYSHITTSLILMQIILLIIASLIILPKLSKTDKLRMSS